MSNNTNNSPLYRKARKLRNKPIQFFKDSKIFIKAVNTVLLTKAKLGSFALVVLTSLFVIIYYTTIASPRFATTTKFVVKEASSNDTPMFALAGLTASSPSMRDALVLKSFIESTQMALTLDIQTKLKSHYENQEWDVLSKLEKNSTLESYTKYYQDHIIIEHDELSDVITIEVQAFDADYSLSLAHTVLEISENFINRLSDKIINQQLLYAKEEVQTTYENAQNLQANMIVFQDKYNLFQPEAQGEALAHSIVELENQITKESAELNHLLSIMHDDTHDVKTKRAKISALVQQANIEKSKLTNQNTETLNNIAKDYTQLKRELELATQLQQSAIVSLEKAKSDAYKQAKHLLVIQNPIKAQESKYPDRLYNIFTWFVALIIAYVITVSIITTVKEHKA